LNRKPSELANAWLFWVVDLVMYEASFGLHGQADHEVAVVLVKLKLGCPAGICHETMTSLFRSIILY
jgi:hypothetical protein